MPLPRHFKIFVLLALMPVFGACQYEVPKDPTTLVWHVPAEPNSLNPLISNDAYESLINSLIYDRLIERDNTTLLLKPKMAESYTLSEDKLSITYTLRKDLKWHDGKPVTADDVVFSYKRIMDPKIDAAVARTYFSEFQEIQKLDPYTVRFISKRPYFRSFFTSGSIPILPKHLFKKGEDFNNHAIGRNPMGNGPYKFVRWTTGQEIVLERNEDYWGPKPEIKKISFRFVPDPSTSFQMLKKGELDMANVRTIQWVRQTDSKKFQEQFRKLKYFSLNYSYIGWNLRRPYFSDVRVRKAITHLINREAIQEKIYFGLTEMTTGPFFKGGLEYNQALKPYSYDLKKAKALLKSAGWIDHDRDGVRDKDGVPFQFTLSVPASSASWNLFATLLKEDLHKMGIQMEIRQSEWAAFIKSIDDRDFDACLLAWASPVESDPYQVWHSSQTEKGSNFIGYKNGEVDKIIEEARGVFDPVERGKLYQKMHAILHREQPYTFLYISPELLAINRRFQNVQLHPLGVDPLEWKLSY